MKMPLMGLGTYGLTGRKCIKIVQEALEIGYQHLDTASVYENHEAIGKAIRGFDRKKLFITSKIALEQVNDANVEESVRAACKLALNELQVDYLDLYLIHWPSRDRPLNAILQAMHQLAREGRIRYVGVSNYTIRHIQDALNAGLLIEANQVEFHPYLFQKELEEFCQKKKIQLIAYRPFGKGKLLQEEALFDEIGKKYKKSGAQVILRWIIQKGIPVIPKASSKKHLLENFSIFDFELSFEDMILIDRLNRDKRYCMLQESEFNY